MDQLLKLISAPKKPKEVGTPKSWEKIERRLGIPLPSDYKNLIDRFGSGSFDNFIQIYNPFAQNEYLNLFFALDTLHEAERQTKMLGDSAWTVVNPFELFPAPRGLLPWGSTNQIGHTFFWKTVGEPQTWETVFYNLRSGEYEVWKYSLTEFIDQLFRRQIESVLLSEDFPSPDGLISFIPAE